MSRDRAGFHGSPFSTNPGREMTGAEAVGDDVRAPEVPSGRGAGPSPDTPEDPTAGALREAVEGLPEPHRRVILARHRDHLDFDDIAELLAMTQAEARTLWLRAVERLHRRMDQVP